MFETSNEKKIRELMSMMMVGSIKVKEIWKIYVEQFCLVLFVFLFQTASDHNTHARSCVI